MHLDCAFASLIILTSIGLSRVARADRAPAVLIPIPSLQPSAHTTEAPAESPLPELPSADSAVPADSPSAANSAAHFELRGQLAFWKRPVCASGLNCEMPQTMTPSVSISASFDRPSKVGPTLVSLAQYHSDSWTVEMSLFWVNPLAGDTTPSYLVTQVRLTEASLGVVAECSRYDGIEGLKFFMPGSCSGRSGEWMFGVSTITTGATP